MNYPSYYYATKEDSTVFIHTGKEINCDYSGNIEKFVLDQVSEEITTVAVLLNDLVFLHPPLLKALENLNKQFKHRLVLLDAPDFVRMNLQRWNIFCPHQFKESWRFSFNYIKRFDDALEICKAAANSIKKEK